MSDSKKEQAKAKKTAPQRSKKTNTSRKKKVRPAPSRDDDLVGFLVEGEEVVLRAEIHGAIYWRSVAILIFAAILWFFIMPLGVVLGVFGALMLCIAILTQHYLLLAVTNKRVLARYGLLQMDVVDIRLSKIESIDLERMLPGHIFGYANVVVAGTGQRILRVPYIRNANAFRKFYNEMALAEEGSEEANEAVAKAKDDILDTKS